MNKQTTALTSVILLLLCGCGGTAFSAGSEAGVDDSPTGDAPAMSDGLTAQDSGPAHDAGPDDGAQEDAPDHDLLACETYYHARVSGCACALNPPWADAATATQCGARQYDDAGGLDCVRADLATCEAACGLNDLDGGGDYNKLCDCIYACLGPCAATNALYFACDSQFCNASNCP